MIHAKKISCEKCGRKILMLPDIKAMSRAIENHVNSHKVSALARSRLANNLSQQALLAAVKDKPVRVWLLVESYFGSRRVHGVALTEREAEAWADAQSVANPSGSFFYDTSEVVQGGQ